MATFREAFGERLIVARFNHGRISQEAVAERAEITRTNISLYENGRRVPSVEIFVKLAGALEIDAAGLLGPIRWKHRSYGGGRFEFGEDA